MKDIAPLSCSEKIIFSNPSVTGCVLDFWQWSYSCLNSPAVRGDLAEYLVYLALKGNNVSHNHYQTRMDWDVVDLTYGRGIGSNNGKPYFCKSTSFGWGVEIKSSSTANKSEARFNISKKEGYHFESNTVVEHQRNWADIHIFALLTNEDHQNAPLRLEHWEFYLIPTYKIQEYRTTNRKDYKSIGISGLVAAGATISKHEDLKTKIDTLILRNYVKLEQWKLEHDKLKKQHIRQKP
jgi:hypothetical protein